MATIFESPDNGKTIFSRPIREIVESDEYTQKYPSNISTKITSLTGMIDHSFNEEDSEFFKNMRKKQQDEKLWRDIRHTAKTNDDLQEILNQAIMLYTLSKEE